MSQDYDFKSLESRWQAKWQELRLFEPHGDGEPYYCLMMYPYPSGALHMGHIINYSIGDAMVRYHLMRGRRVLTPMGWDSFGLPAENHAIRTGTPPAESTKKCIDAMRRQMIRAGFGYDWSREIATSHPGYYRWTQWLFLKFFEKGLAFRKRAPVNWCSSCRTVLANEQVHDDACERCGTVVDQKDLEQWFFRMSSYAQRLLDGHEQLQGKWPDRVIKMQKAWIGRSEGARLEFEIVAPGAECHGEKIPVFTTRPDTTYGVTFFSLAPEHSLVVDLVRGTEREQEVLEACRKMRNQDRVERASEESEKTGVFTGRHVRNPFDGSLAEIWVCNYVLMDYGTGAVMAVPAHDQRDFLFARKYGLPVKVVIQPSLEEPLAEASMTESHEGGGVQVASGPLDGIDSRVEAIRQMTSYAKEQGFGDFSVHYRLKDWLLSRQRYWGAPIPIVYCEECGIVPVPEAELPVLLPKEVEFRPAGDSPLATCESFVRTRCPRCQREARRETDTMDTFVDSSWYLYRYLSPGDEERPFDAETARNWIPVHQYVGGIEHATMHLIYARFFAMVLHDLGLLEAEEPFQRLFCQGMVCARAYRCETHKWLSKEEIDLDGMTCKECGGPVTSEMTKMSKTKKNGVSPDALFEQYGADTVHTSILFSGPPDQSVDYNERSVRGIHRFLRRFWDTLVSLVPKVSGVEPWTAGRSGDLSGNWKTTRRVCHGTLKRVTEAFDKHGFHFNTCIAGSMESLNALRAAGDPKTEEERAACRESILLMTQILAPFAPHLAEELWDRLEQPGPSIFRQPWPCVDQDALAVEEVEIAVQVNGKLRGQIRVPAGVEKEAALATAREAASVQKHLQGKTIKREIYVPNRLINFVAR